MLNGSLEVPESFQFPMEGVGHQGTGCRQMHIQCTSQPNPPSVLGKHGFTGFVLCKMYISCFFFFLRIQLCKHEEDNKQYEGKHRDRTQGRPREGIFQRARHYDSLPVPQEIKNLLQPQSSTIYDLRTKQPLSFPRVNLSWDIQIGSAPLKRSGMVTGGAGCPEQAAVGGSIGRRHKWLCASSHLGNHVQPHQRLSNTASTIPSVNSNEFREITHGTNINMSVPTGIFNPERPFCFFSSVSNHTASSLSLPHALPRLLTCLLIYKSRGILEHVSRQIADSSQIPQIPFCLSCTTHAWPSSTFFPLSALELHSAHT